MGVRVGGGVALELGVVLGLAGEGSGVAVEGGRGWGGGHVEGALVLVQGATDRGGVHEGVVHAGVG